MRLLDRIALNRLLSIITGFLLAITKILISKSDIDQNPDEETKPERKRPWLRKRKTQ